MTMVCQICSHSKRLEIDKEIAGGGNLSQIARKYGVPTDSLYYHRDNHLSRQLTQAYQRKELAESIDLLGTIEDILGKAKNIFDRNYAQEKDSLALKALDSQRATVDLFARIATDLHSIRIAELQLARTSSADTLKEREAAFAEKAADHLNDKELDMLEQLLSKIEGETKEVIIPCDRPYKVPAFIPETAPDPEPEEQSPDPKSPQAKKERPAHAYKPIQPTPIPSEPTRRVKRTLSRV